MGVHPSHRVLGSGLCPMGSCLPKVGVSQAAEKREKEKKGEQLRPEERSLSG